QEFGSQSPEFPSEDRCHTVHIPTSVFPCAQRRCSGTARLACATRNRDGTAPLPGAAWFGELLSNDDSLPKHALQVRFQSSELLVRYPESHIEFHFTSKGGRDSLSLQNHLSDFRATIVVDSIMP